MLVIGERAKVWVDCVKVRSGVAVIGLRHSIIGSNGRGPHCRYAQLLEVIQMLLDAGKISSMPPALSSAIVARGIVGRLPVSKSIGHDEVKHVGGRETAVAIGLVRALGQHIGVARLAVIVACTDRNGLWRGRLGSKPQKGPMAVFRSLAADEGNAIAAQCEARMVQSLAVDQEHGVRKAGPPSGRIDLIDTWSAD